MAYWTEWRRNFRKAQMGPIYWKCFDKNYTFTRLKKQHEKTDFLPRL